MGPLPEPLTLETAGCALHRGDAVWGQPAHEAQTHIQLSSSGVTDM